MQIWQWEHYREYKISSVPGMIYTLVTVKIILLFVSRKNFPVAYDVTIGGTNR